LVISHTINQSINIQSLNQSINQLGIKAIRLSFKQNLYKELFAFRISLHKLNVFIGVLE